MSKDKFLPQDSNSAFPNQNAKDPEMQEYIDFMKELENERN